MNKNLYLLIVFIIELFKVQSLLINNNPDQNQNLQEIKDGEEELSDEIVIIYTNDIHCGLMDYIGYDGLMLYKKELQKKYKHILTIDTGDHIQGDTIGVLSKGIDIINIMNKIGYDVTILGNHEFDYGIEALQNCSDNLNNGYICTNFCYRKNKTSIFPPYKIIEIGGKKIGFIAVLTPTTLTKTYLYKYVDENNKLIYDFLCEKDDCNELYERVQNITDFLRNIEEVDYVILLSHIGNEGDTKYSTKNILKNVNGIDGVLDGHTHKVYNTTCKDKDEKDIKIIQGGTKLKYFGIIKLMENETYTELMSEIPKPTDTSNAIEIDRNNKKVWVDKEMNEYIQRIIDSHSEELNRVIGNSTFDLNINKEEDDFDHHNQISRYQESTLCDLITDAIRILGEGQISIMSAGSVRTDLKKGNITYKNILDILPFNNEIVVKDVSGQDILDALEYGMRLLPEKSSRFPQVSGISFKVNLAIKSSVEVDNNEMFIKVNGDRRVSNVKVGKKKLDKKKKYRISFDNFIGGGGDGYNMFSHYEETYNTLKTDNEALIEYIQKDLNGTIDIKYNTTQGRINIVSEKENNNLVLAIIILFIFLILVFIIIIICVKVKQSFMLPIRSKDIENNDESIVQED